MVCFRGQAANQMTYTYEAGDPGGCAWRSFVTMPGSITAYCRKYREQLKQDQHKHKTGGGLRMTSRTWVTAVFALVQSVGIACSWLWPYAPSDVGVVLWGTGLVLLIPGNFVASWIVEDAFWRSGLSLTSMGVLSTLLLFVINALLWFALVKAFRHIRARRNASVPLM